MSTSQKYSEGIQFQRVTKKPWNKSPLIPGEKRKNVHCWLESTFLWTYKCTYIYRVKQDICDLHIIHVFFYFIYSWSSLFCWLILYTTIKKNSLTECWGIKCLAQRYLEICHLRVESITRPLPRVRFLSTVEIWRGSSLMDLLIAVRSTMKCKGTKKRKTRNI